MHRSGLEKKVNNYIQMPIVYEQRHTEYINLWPKNALNKYRNCLIFVL